MQADSIALQVLGPVTVVTSRGTVVIAGKLKQRCLARLALEPGRPVPPDILIDAMWGETAPRTAKQSLHVHISAVRDRLRPLGAAELIITTDAGEYVLGIDADYVDAHQFASEVDDGLAALRSQRFGYAARQLSTALARFAEPYASLDDYQPAIPERHRLVAVHEQACDGHIDALLAQEHFEDALPLLRATVAGGPLRERPYEQMIELYRRTGNEVLARQVVVDATRVFQEALGIGPSQRLTELATLSSQHTDQSPTSAAEEGRAQSAGREHDVPSRPYRVAPDLPGRWLVPTTTQEIMLDLDRVDPRTSVLRTRLSAAGDGLGLSPLLDFAGLDEQLTMTDLTLHRNATFQRLVRGIESEGPAVVVIEDLHRAAPVLTDFLVWALSRPGSVATLSFIGLYDSAVPNQVIERLASRCDTFDVSHDPTTDQRPPDVGPTDGVDANEGVLLSVLEHAILPAPTEVIAAASGLSAPDVQQGLHRLRARALLIDRPGGRLDLSRGMRQHSTENNRSADIDLALANTLRAQLADDDPYRLVAEAHHRLQALPDGDADVAWSCAQFAAVRFDQLDSHQDLVALGRLVEPVDAAAPITANELHFRALFGRALVRTGDPAGGEAMLRVLVDVARDEHPQLFGELVRFLIERTTPQLQPESRPLVQEALDQIGPEPTDVRVHLLSNLSGMWFLVDQQRSAELAEQCLLSARETRRPNSIATALNGQIQALMLPGNADVRLDLALESQQSARQANSTESLCLALTYEAQALIEQGLLARAEAPLRYAQALSDQIQVPRFCWWADAWTALLNFAGGKVDDAEARFVAAHDRWPGARDPVQCLGVQLATLWLLQGRGADLLPMLDQYDTQGTDAAITSTRAFALAQAGHVDESTELIDHLVSGGLIAQVRDITRPFALAMTSEAASLTDHRSVGEELMQLIEPIADVHVTLNVWGGGGCYWGSLLHGLGLSQRLAGHDAATATLVAAAAANSDAGAHAFAARSHQAAEHNDR